MFRVSSIFFLPPLAIARVGGSDTPLECFEWETGRTIADANRTVIRPAVTLLVLADGSLRPYRPGSIQFRDDDLLRPVAPFFELWARVNDEHGQDQDMPITLELLESQQLTIDSVSYTLTVANRKAQRRTGSPSCAFIAQVDVAGSDHERKQLLAFSPHNRGEEPLVFFDRPIPLGHFQVMKPTRGFAMNVNLSILRVRFTPARGDVYGPPEAIAAPASPLPPGGVLPAQTLGGRLHEIVPAHNRLLNSKTPWSDYIMDVPGQQDPQPSDSYDGANVGSFRSWSVVDDTCDGVLRANVVIAGQRLTATARVFSCCPDYAPDRRPFFSFADDLADRDNDAATDDDVKVEIPELFVRIFETASMVNLEATRQHAIEENVSDPPHQNFPELPAIGDKTMTAEDQDFVDLVPDLLPKGEPLPKELVRSEIARTAHAPLSDVESLIDLLRTKRDFVTRLIRPPFGRFAELATIPGPRPQREFRDPRVVRDVLHDMRMPPYMRDSDETPLSLTHRQYSMLLRYIELALEPEDEGDGTKRPDRRDSTAAGRVSRLTHRLSHKP